MTRISLTAAKAKCFHIFIFLPFIAVQSISNAPLKATRVTSITNIITAPSPALSWPRVAVIKWEILKTRLRENSLQCASRDLAALFQSQRVDKGVLEMVEEGEGRRGIKSDKWIIFFYNFNLSLCTRCTWPWAGKARGEAGHGSNCGCGGVALSKFLWPHKFHIDFLQMRPCGMCRRKCRPGQQWTMSCETLLTRFTVTNLLERTRWLQSFVLAIWPLPLKWHNNNII